MGYNGMENNYEFRNDENIQDAKRNWLADWLVDWLVGWLVG